MLSDSPITLADHSEPEPDVMVVAGSIRDYLDHHPGPAEIRLVVEVSDSTLAFDRTVKARLYAQSQILEYWIVNLPERRLEVFRSPSADIGYRVSEIFTDTDQVISLSFPDVSVSVAQLLP